VPEQPQHAALASEYAHVTAPLRRLGDRYAGEVCVALCAGNDVPEWVLARLEELPRVLQESAHRASSYERAILDLVEAGILKDRVGEVFDAVVVEVEEKDPRRGDITIQEPAVEGRLHGAEPLPLGTDVRVRLTAADVASRSVSFELE
jgi:exoribonuclease R